MRRVHRFLGLARPDRCLLVESALLLGALRFGLSLLPFRLVRRLADRLSAWRAGQGVGQLPTERIAWAIAAVSQYLPAATCLARALAAQVLLVRHGYPAILRIGVARDVAGRLEAHAWIESEGRVVLGGSPELER
jgi:hypothetical protein